MNSQRIVLVGPFPPFRGGIADFNAALYKALEEAGHEVYAVSFKVQYPRFLFPGKTQFREPHADDVPAERLIHSLQVATWLKTAGYIARLQPHCVIFRYWLPFMAPALGTIARQLRKKLPEAMLLALTDNVIPHEKRPGDVALTRYFVKPFHGFITMSRQVLNDLEAFTSNSHKVLHPHPLYEHFGVRVPKAEARAYLHLDPSQRLILFFGLVRPYKGLRLLLEAMAHPKGQTHPPIHLLIAGEFYEPVAHYQTLIEKLGLTSTVQIRNAFIPQQDVKYYFSAADLVAMPYLSATQSGISQIAFQMERPMLVTNTGGLAEWVRNSHEGYVVAPDAEEIAQALCHFYTGQHEAEMTENVARAKSRFGWQAMVKAIFALQDQIRTQKTQ